MMCQTYLLSKMNITKDWPVADIVALYPHVAPILAEYGLHCVGCSASEFETLEEGCLGHGMTEEDVTNLVSDLNDFIASTPARPMELAITKDAALAIKQIGESEQPSEAAPSKTFGLSVLSDPSGNFFMEFREAPDEGDHVFRHEEVPDVSVFASFGTLQHIGGATIDVQDGKFKLDVGSACSCDKNHCSCPSSAVPSQ